MKKVISFLLLSAFVICCLSTAFASSVSNLIQFNSKMMPSVSSQINEATDLTISESNRALLAALLTLEFQVQESNVEIDYQSPIYVAKYGTVVSASFNTSKGYVVVMYQMHPLTTYYSFSNSTDATIAKLALEMSSDSVWEVPFAMYYEMLAQLVNQIS